ncbi:hypothetical protein SDC9_124448 [bioreactor metagenome]|uniref:Uncharacterized protein n=1 Tax=bioreactor metagenome TaxID=1076179 RepID=A0A645CKI1_9ZZZZ
MSENSIKGEDVSPGLFKEVDKAMARGDKVTNKNRLKPMWTAKLLDFLLIPSHSLSWT